MLSIKQTIGLVKLYGYKDSFEIICSNFYNNVKCCKMRNRLRATKQTPD